MISRALIFFSCICLAITIACTKHSPDAQVVVEIPSNFNGNFVLDMGARNASPLPKQGDAYIIAVPRDGKLETSTLLQNPKVIFKNSSAGSVWGYSQSTFTTGDGISVGGKIEFFVGSQKEFEADQSRKKHSGAIPAPAELDISGV